MILPLPLHLFIHFFLAVIIGMLVGRFFNERKLGLIGGILGGFFIDLDHILEYFLVFGPTFNLIYFFQGREFLVSDQIHTWFHAWEYVPILFSVAWLFRSRKRVLIFILALALGIFVHLVSDSFINHYPFRNYSLIYRSQLNFSVPLLLSPEQYQEYIKDRQDLGL